MLFHELIEAFGAAGIRGKADDVLPGAISGECRQKAMARKIAAFEPW
jgi:hypothetical protein